MCSQHYGCLWPIAVPGETIRRPIDEQGRMPYIPGTGSGNVNIGGGICMIQGVLYGNVSRWNHSDQMSAWYVKLPDGHYRDYYPIPYGIGRAIAAHL